jgi:hypothetical protein
MPFVFIAQFPRPAFKASGPCLPLGLGENMRAVLRTRPRSHFPTKERGRIAAGDRPPSTSVRDRGDIRPPPPAPAAPPPPHQANCFRSPAGLTLPKLAQILTSRAQLDSPCVARLCYSADIWPTPFDCHDTSLQPGAHAGHVEAPPTVLLFADVSEHLATAADDGHN